MPLAKLFLGVLGLFLLISLASSGSVNSTDAYGEVVDVDLRSMYVYWISCKKYDKTNSTLPCRILQRSLYGEQEEQFCDLELSSYYLKKLQALSEDSVALHWYAPYESNFQLATTVINITNCNKVEARVDNIVTLFDIAYADSFRLATTFISSDGKYHTISYNRDACNSNLCVSTFDAEDDKITSFYKSAFEQNKFISDIKYLDFGNESFLVDQVWKFSLLQPTGYKLLIRYDLSDTHGESFKHRMLRLCQNSTSKHDQINCTAFDANGEIVSNVTVNLSHEADDIDVENLANGEFLLFTYTKKWEHNYVSKFGADGKHVGTIELTGMPECRDLCGNKGDLKIINNKYCRSIVRQSINRGFNYNSVCFSDGDFNN